MTDRSDAALEDTRAELARVQKQLDDAHRWVLRRWAHQAPGVDRACAHCVPGGDVVVRGFVCVPHRALLDGTPDGGPYVDTAVVHARALATDRDAARAESDRHWRSFLLADAERQAHRAEAVQRGLMLDQERERMADLEHYVGAHLTATGTCSEADEDGQCTDPECTYCEMARALQPLECGAPLVPRGEP